MRRVALVVVGLVLVAAGIAKIAALSSPVDSLGWPREMIVAGSAVELLLGAWLISGVAIRAAHLAAIAIFLLFAALSTYQVIRGVPSCGCLGKLYVHPAWMLGFDLLTLTALAATWIVERRRSVSTPTAQEPAAPRASRRFAIYGASLGGVAFFSLIAVGWVFAGSFDRVQGLAWGAEVVLSPSTIDLGTATIGEKKVATVRVVNASSGPIRIVGGKNNCGCMVTGNLPAVVPARGSAEFPIEVSIGNEGFREVVFTLYSDQKALRPLTGRVRFDGKAPPAAESTD